MGIIMAPLTPFIKVLAGGSPVSGLFYQRLKSCTITDQSGQQSDTLKCVFENRGNSISLPSEGDILEPFFGYRETGISTMGQFVVDGWTITGGQSGELLNLSARSADIRENQKEKGSEHFDNQTLGAILQKSFGRVGATIEVAGELAGKQIEYEARYDQSVLDFATRLADRYNAIFKPGGGKFLFVPRGAGTMGAIHISKSECASWSIQGKPRPKFKQVAAKWHDPKTGKTEFEKEDTGGKGPIRVLKNPYRTKEEAKEAAKSEGIKQNRESSSGHFEQYGRIDASAEADVMASGFGQGIDGQWRADQVEHTFEAGGGGFKTKVNVKAPESQKEA